MKSLLIKSLIVVSKKENVSREIGFSEGLNIIFGKNKTGKSSLIKSILYTFGCEVKFEDDWKKLIDYFLLNFELKGESFCILRRNKEFSIYKFEHEKPAYLLLRTNSFHEYSKCIMEVLNVTMDCLTNDGKEISATPPLLFRYQYIDQDMGWHKIGESFSNFGYIKDGKTNSNKYIVGYQGEEYYKNKKQIALAKERIELLKHKLENYEELMEVLSTSLNYDEQTIESSSKSLVYKANITHSTLDKLNNLEKERLYIEEQISILKSQRYEKYLSIEMLKKQVKELTEDHEFALLENEIIKCPFCGVNHNNTIEARTEIVKDIQTGNELISIQRSEVKTIEEKIKTLQEDRSKIFSEYKYLKKRAEEVRETANIINTYKTEGKNEIVVKSLNEINRVKNEISNERNIRTFYEEEIKKLNSINSRNDIRNAIINNLNDVLTKLNLPTTYIKLKDFVQVLTKTGSDGPRIILAYHIALYLYNISRHSNIFEWMVIDTPNQQGQDDKNIKNIDSVLSLLLDKGQVILGTERKTGFEENANNFIELTQYRRCLSNDKYQEHINLIDELDSIGIAIETSIG